MLHPLKAAVIATLAILSTGVPPASAGPIAPVISAAASSDAVIRYRTVEVDGIPIFYREAGPPDGPVLLLLHGFPTSSHMYRDLIPRLADRYRVIAPDYPGFGQSGAPDRAAFAYTFDRYAELMAGFTDRIGIDRYALYVMDYGAPVGFRLATARQDRVTALIVQNGNAYDEGIGDFWKPIKTYWASNSAADREALRPATEPAGVRWQYTDGVPADRLDRVNPDAWTMDQAGLDRPGNREIQLDLFRDYQTNLPLYPRWQAWMRDRRPPTLVMWGRNDQIFLVEGARAYARDNPEAEIHELDTGHFALETHGPEIAGLIRDFLGRRVTAR
jgi:pimeloyl-ACP methyl ester carboxylesterase